MKLMTETETRNTNGGLLGWLAIGAGVTIIVAGGIKAYKDADEEANIGDKFCDAFGNVPLVKPFCRQ